MRVTWTVQVSSRTGNYAVCRNEAEAAQLVLELFLEGVPRKCIIVDGVCQERLDMTWALKALGL